MVQCKLSGFTLKLLKKLWNWIWEPRAWFVTKRRDQQCYQLMLPVSKSGLWRAWNICPRKYICMSLFQLQMNLHVHLQKPGYDLNVKTHAQKYKYTISRDSVGCCWTFVTGFLIMSTNIRIRENGGRTVTFITTIGAVLLWVTLLIHPDAGAAVFTLEVAFFAAYWL